MKKLLYISSLAIFLFGCSDIEGSIEKIDSTIDNVNSVVESLEDKKRNLENKIDDVKDNINPSILTVQNKKLGSGSDSVKIKDMFEVIFQNHEWSSSDGDVLYLGNPKSEIFKEQLGVSTYSKEDILLTVIMIKFKSNDEIIMTPTYLGAKMPITLEQDIIIDWLYSIYLEEIA